MKIISDNILINHITKGKSTSFETLYRLYFPPISSYIKKNSGSEEDAEDIFQETIIILLQKVKQPEFKLTSTLKTYLFSISKNLWLNKLRNNKLISVDDFEKYHLRSEDTSINHQLEKIKEEKIHHWITKITENCQRILKAIFFYNEPMDILMKKMGWKNKHVAANQKYKCIQKVIREKIKEA